MGQASSTAPLDIFFGIVCALVGTAHNIDLVMFASGTFALQSSEKYFVRISILANIDLVVQGRGRGPYCGIAGTRRCAVLASARKVRDLTFERRIAFLGFFDAAKPSMWFASARKAVRRDRKDFRIAWLCFAVNLGRFLGSGFTRSEASRPF